MADYEALELEFSSLKEGYHLRAPYYILKSRLLNNLKLSAITLKYEFLNYIHRWRKYIKLFCQFRGKAIGADSGLLYFPNLSAADESWDKDLACRFFPIGSALGSLFSISINTLSLQRHIRTHGMLHLWPPWEENQVWDIKSCNNTDVKMIHFKAIELWLNLFSGSSSVILIHRGQVGIADVQVANQFLYPMSHLCDTNREEAVA